MSGLGSGTPINPLFSGLTGIGGISNGRYWSSSSQVYGSPAQFTAAQQHARTAITAAQQQALFQALTGETWTESPVKDAGIRVGEIIGWRCWKVLSGWLYSWTNDECEWEPGEYVEAHEIGPRVGQGVHAFKTRRAALAYTVNSATPWAVGRVALWGQIYEFEKGWHGEFAKVHSLDIAFERAQPRAKWWHRFKKPGTPPLTTVEQLRQTYGLSEAPA